MQTYDLDVTKSNLIQRRLWNHSDHHGTPLPNDLPSNPHTIGLGTREGWTLSLEDG